MTNHHIVTTNPIINDEQAVRWAINHVLELNGYDTSNEHFARTADRWIAAIGEFNQNGSTTSGQILGVEFTDVYTGMVVVHDIEYSSLCPHHLFPYSGIAHVGYLPSGKIVGISKLARLVEFYTHRITTQEEATRMVVDSLMTELKPLGAICVMTGTHTCMTCRGAQAGLSKTTTADLAGVFKSNEHGARDEFYRIVGAVR